MLKRALFLVLPLSLGCGGTHERDLPDDRVWESVHFRYHTRSDDRGACEAVLEKLERHFELMQGYLSFSWPQGRKVDYFKFRDAADYAENAECPEGSGSCASGSTIFSPSVLEDHELIHAYLAPLALPPAFFTEGIATALACDHLFTVEEPKAWQDVVAVPFDDDVRAHIEGPWFVGYLLHAYGPATFLSFYSQLDYRSATVESISDTFETAYGASLEDVWTAALAFSHRLLCVNLWNCSGAPLPLDGSLVSLEQACDGDDASRTFELSTPTDVVITSHRYFLNAPLSCDVEEPWYVGGAAEPWSYGTLYNASLVTVPAGKYFVNSAAEGGLADVGIRTLPAPTYSHDCTGLEPLDLAGDELLSTDFNLSVPNDGESWFVKLHLASGRTFYTGADATEEVEECSACDDTSSCAPVSYDAHPDADGNVTLRLTPPAAGPGYTTYLIRPSVVLN